MRTLDCEKLQLSIVPGPTETSEVELSSDIDLEDQVELDPAEVVTALLEIEGVSSTSTADPSSFEWEASLTASGMTMRIVMTLLEPEDAGPFWGGFTLHGKMPVDEICRVAQELRSKLGSVWIHDGECMMRTPDAFRDAMRA